MCVDAILYVFGPLCVEPTLHNLGVGRMLLEETLPLAKKLGYPGVVIFGEPGYYPKRGFQTCDAFGITTPDGSNFDAFMAYPLDDEMFAKIHGSFYEDPVFEKCNDLEAVTAYTREFSYPKPLKLACQWLHAESRHSAKMKAIAKQRKQIKKIDANADLFFLIFLLL